MGVCCNFDECKRKIFVKHLVEDFYFYVWDLSIEYDVPFRISECEFSFIFSYIYDILKIRDYQEFHEVVDIYICYMLVGCNEEISMRYMMRSFHKHLDMLTQFLCRLQIEKVCDRESKVLVKFYE